MKKIRDTERPPAPRKEAAPVSVVKSRQVHLASRMAPPFFCSPKTLCGCAVDSLLAVGPSGVSCPRCIELAKESA